MDVRYLQERLGGLKNVGGGLGNTVETVVQERPVPRKSLRERMTFTSAAGAAAGGAADASEAASQSSTVNGEGEGEKM